MPSSGMPISGLLRRQPPEHTARLTAIKGQVRRELALGGDDTVVVRQLDCAEPGCPPVETVVAVLAADGTTRRWTLHHPVADITPRLLATTLASTPVTTER
ncbi:hypothetical protein ABH931_002714 [Streptacidiphilus sp. MAP12-33]|uniref:hypothetical protein n=1 Tax=Streptacidiphilus sp. MAP12-33 TaxID=3156266 RepID=UPI003511D092